MRNSRSPSQTGKQVLTWHPPPDIDGTAAAAASFLYEGPSQFTGATTHFLSRHLLHREKKVADFNTPAP